MPNQGRLSWAPYFLFHTCRVRQGGAAERVREQAMQPPRPGFARAATPDGPAAPVAQFLARPAAEPVPMALAVKHPAKIPTTLP